MALILDVDQYNSLRVEDFIWVIFQIVKIGPLLILLYAILDFFYF